jgi:hypothetical protein
VERVCRILLERLNADGSRWGNPQLRSTSQREEGVDCYADDGANRLRIQVTRAEGSRGFWARLANKGRIKGNVPVDALADVLRKSIERKAMKTAEQQRPGVLLALDATETAGLVLDGVVAMFQRKHGAWAAGLGFQSIWLVGPNTRLTSRLDVRFGA